MTVKARAFVLVYVAAHASVAGTMPAHAAEPAAPATNCALAKNDLSRSQIVEVAKKQLSSREPQNKYSDISAEPTDDKCAWLVVATQEPPQPGGARYILIANDGRMIEYRGGH